MHRLAVVLLLLSTLLWAETQEEAYYRAMKSEEAGEVASALKAFEDAAALPGPYTEEIKEILKSYYDALGVSDSESGSLSFRMSGDAGIYGLRYDEMGSSKSEDEYGGDMYLSSTTFLDYIRGSWMHTLGFSFSGDWFLMNDNMPTLDTNDWRLSWGVEYSLVGQTLMLNAGVDVNLAEGEDVSATFYGWAHKEFFRIGKNRFGTSGWAYYDTKGPMSLAAYASWNRTSTYGFSGSAYLGFRFDADYVSDYKKFITDYQKILKEATDDICTSDDYRDECKVVVNDGWGYSVVSTPMAYCMENYGAQCFGMDENTIDSLYWEYRVDELMDSVVVPVSRYYGKWIGPNLRSKVSYKFRSSISLEAKLNLFYGFVIDGPDPEYEDIQKLVLNWGLMAYWKPNHGTVYLGLEQIYKSYSLPKYYKKIFSKGNLLTELKAGVKWEI